MTKPESVVRRRVWGSIASAALIWGSTIVASLLMTVLSSARPPSFLEVIVERPLALIVTLIVVSFSLSLVLRTRFDQQWQESITTLPWAILAAVLLSWTSVWNDGSGTAALSLHDAALFVFSLGLWPTTLGPELLLRGTAVILAILIAVRVWKRQTNLATALLVFGVVWIPAALLLLVQTWMAQVAGLFRETSIQHSLDASRVLGLIHTNSYWSNFQADRFFAGVGNQLETGIGLSSAALIFLIGWIVLKLSLLRLQPWNRPGVIRALLKRVVGLPLLLLVSPLACGLLVGFRGQRFAWNGLDLLALFILIVVFVSWFLYWTFGRDLEDLVQDERDHPERPLPSGVIRPDELEGLREVLICSALIGAFLLGWPVLLAVLALFGLGWISSATGFGWDQYKRDRIAVWATVSVTLLFMGGAFAARSTILPSALFPLALVWGLITAILKTQSFFFTDPSRPLPLLGFIGVGGIIVALILKTPVILALVALLLLGLFLLHKKTKNWPRWAFFSVLAFGWLAALLSQF